MTKKELIEALKDVPDDCEIVLGAKGVPQSYGYWLGQIYESYSDYDPMVILTNPYMDEVSRGFRLIYESESESD